MLLVADCLCWQLGTKDVQVLRREEGLAITAQKLEQLVVAPRCEVGGLIDRPHRPRRPGRLDGYEIQRARALDRTAYLESTFVTSGRSRIVARLCLAGR